MKEKRYIVTMCFSLWAETDAEATKTALNIAEMENIRFDNRCAIMQIEYAPVHTLQRPIIYKTETNE